MDYVSRIFTRLALGSTMLLGSCAGSQLGSTQSVVAESSDKPASSSTGQTAGQAGMVMRSLQPDEKASVRAALVAVLPNPERMKLRFGQLRLPASGGSVVPYCGTYAIFHTVDPLYTGGPYRLMLRISDGKVQEVTATVVVPPSLLEKGMLASLPAITSTMRTCAKDGYDLKRQATLDLE